MIDRKDYMAEKQEKACFKQASYLAKDSQKNSTGKWQHEIFTSRLKPLKKRN